MLCEDDLQDEGRFKMNPPLRSRRRPATRCSRACCDGTIDCDRHRPRARTRAEEKSRGLAGSPMGVVGLETAFPVLYTDLARRGGITLELADRC